MQLRSSTASTAGRATAAAKGRCPAVACKALEARRTGSAKDMGFANQLEALKMMSKVVADTGDPALVKKYKPQDCTTNPSLVLKAVQAPEYAHHLGEALKGYQKSKAMNPDRPFAEVADILAVNIGADMLNIVPGRVSTEVDAHLSYDTQATYEKALRIMDLYSKKGIDPKRIYIKIASTWEGIEACRKLQRQGIDCNMTLLFSFAQAVACAEAGAALISPFVGRILDWYKAKVNRDFPPHEDPGVLSVKRIYTYYKTHEYKTIVMAASFRNVGEIRELAGCDNITISPQLLSELESCTDPLTRMLHPDTYDPTMTKLTMNKTTFDAMHNADQMAVDKLGQGIEGFAADHAKLEALLADEAKKLGLY